MGELRTRKRGKTWEWSFEGAKIGGKRKPISKGGYRTKAEALAAGTQAKAEYDNTGRTFKPSEISLSDYMDYWLENHVKKNLSFNTYCDYESKVRVHIKPDLGIYRLCALESDAIQRWVNRKKTEGYSKSMVKNLLACLSGALQYAVTPCKYIKSNPCQCVKIPKINENPQSKAHTEYICVKADYDKIIERFPEGSNFYIPLNVGYHLGTRIGESYGFNLLTDVDFKNHSISINHQLSCENGIWFYRPPKYESYRTIKMDEIIEGILKDEIKRRKKNMLRYGPYFMRTYLLPDNSIIQAQSNTSMPYTEIMPISTRENGELLTPKSFLYCARVIHYELGNPLFHSHCLRHTHGTILAEGGAQPKTVMERLGHKDIKVTMEKYVFNTDIMQDDAVAIFIKATERCSPTA